MAGGVPVGSGADRHVERHGHGPARHDVPGGANIGLIDQTARFALSRGYHTLGEP